MYTYVCVRRKTKTEIKMFKNAVHTPLKERIILKLKHNHYIFIISNFIYVNAFMCICVMYRYLYRY